MSRRSGNTLEKWEIAIVKGLLRQERVSQDILAYFSRPNRSINNARITEINNGTKHKSVKAASDAEVEDFLLNWPNAAPSTGLNYQADELLIKARAAMTAAVQIFNSGGLYFRSEIFIITAIVAWTYLMHAYYKREDIDYRYDKGGAVEKTPGGADRHWDLTNCISFGKCPLKSGVINNLKFLVGIRNEIEHQLTSRIDDALSAKLQACCINFNDAIKQLFGSEFSLEKRLPIALQFVTFDGAQHSSLKAAQLPNNIATAMDDFHKTLSPDEQADPQFRYKVAFVPLIASKASKSDLAVEFVKAGSPEAKQVERILLKEVERPKQLPTQVVTSIIENGYASFNMRDHTLICQQLDARKPASGYGVMIGNTWYWYDNWPKKVLELLASGWSRPVKMGQMSKTEAREPAVIAS